MYILFISILFFFLPLLWLIRTTKASLFWIYLWQLKEYHPGRFKAHFSTQKGKRLLFNEYLFFKVSILLILLFYWLLKDRLPQPFTRADFLSSGAHFLSDFLFTITLLIFSAVFLIYFAEVAIIIWRIIKDRLKKPVFTRKVILLFLFTLLVEIYLLLFLMQKIIDPNYYNIFYWYLIFGLLLFDILMPLIVSGIVLLFEPTAILWRKKIIKKAREKRSRFSKLIVIGITGSYGKTSTKEFLYEILSSKFNVLKTKDHQNSEIGISRCILNDLNEEHEIFVCEMGAYSVGGIRLLSGIAKPKIGIMTGINAQHSATFGSLEDIINTKYELIESLPKDGLAIFNGYNKYCRDLYEKTTIEKRITNLDLRVEGIKVKKESLSFRVIKGKSSVDFKVNLLGKHWIEDILMAILAAQKLGMKLEEISEACKKIKPLSGSLKLIRNNRGLNLLNATYSANLNGVVSHLEYLKLWPGKKVIIMPCLIELGAYSEQIHRIIGERIGKVCDLALVTHKECFHSMKEGAIDSGMDQDNIVCLSDPSKIFDIVKDFSDENDVILLESRVSSQLLKLLR